jgi:hypothetical protein
MTITLDATFDRFLNDIYVVFSHRRDVRSTRAKLGITTKKIGRARRINKTSA